MRLALRRKAVPPSKSLRESIPWLFQPLLTLVSVFHPGYQSNKGLWNVWSPRSPIHACYAGNEVTNSAPIASIDSFQ